MATLKNLIKSSMIEVVIASTIQWISFTKDKGLISKEKTKDQAYALIYKYLNELGYEKGKGWWRVPGCRSDFPPHAEKISDCFFDIKRLPFKSIFIREPWVEEIRVRPDAAVMISDAIKARVFILEVNLTEDNCYLSQKISAWRGWKEATEKLSQMFGFRVPFFDIVAVNPVPGTIGFRDYLEESCTLK